ncbi:IS30 family transposase [Nocardia zapadnayensis]|nr:IS30 family transposase [Nocardia zapadnayensis]MCX0275079.1 IS30 family transposase [Nocardia zapadnayensis]
MARAVTGPRPLTSWPYQRARRPKPAELAAWPHLRVLVEEKLKSLWSPEQIAGWLRRQFPDDPAMRVSHEAIYLALFDPQRKAIDRTLTQRLRTGRPTRHPKRARKPDGRGVTRGLVPIGERPAEVETRQIAGHWEGELVMGSRPSAIATLVERTSRFTVLPALPDSIEAEQVTTHLTRFLLGLPAPMRRTLTCADSTKPTSTPSPVNSTTGPAGSTDTAARPLNT